MPNVSVIIPAYNAESTIRSTIVSVVSQTYTNYEIIVINDGSTDRTAKIVKTIKDDRIKLFNYQNGGLPTARNRGMRQATGEYIAFLDADDLWTEDKLEKQLAMLEANPEAGVAYSRTSCIDWQGNLLYNCDPISFTGNVFEKLLLTNFLQNGSNPLIRKVAVEAVGEFDPSLKSCEDWDYYLRLAARYPFAIVPEYQIFYRQTLGNMSSNVGKMKQYSYIVLERAYQKVPQSLRCLRSQSLSILHLYCAELYLRNSKFKVEDLRQVGVNLWSSIRLHPPSLFNINTLRMLFKLLLAKILPRQLTHLFTRQKRLSLRSKL